MMTYKDKFNTCKKIPKKTPNRERIKQIESLVKEGKSIAEIADWMGVSRTSIANIIRNCGIKTKRSKS